MDIDIHTASDQKSDAGGPQMADGAGGPDLMMRIQNGSTFHSAATGSATDAKDSN